MESNKKKCLNINSQKNLSGIFLTFCGVFSIFLADVYGFYKDCHMQKVKKHFS